MQKACLYALVCLFIISTTAIASDATYMLSGGLGISQIDNELFLSTSIRPDISIGKFGVGLELTLNFSQDGIRAEDWDSWQKSLARSIRYVRWGQKGNPLYLQAGQLYNAVIGTGILVDNYMNINAEAINGGERRVGLVADLDLKYIGVETLVNDVVTPTMYAGRLFTHPTAYLPFIKGFDRLTIGVSMAQDNRSDAPYNQLSMTAIDAYYPIARALELYAHQARIADHGSGWGAGARGRLGALGYLAEIRQMDSDFVASPISKQYEDHGIDWANYPPDGERTQGYLLGLSLNLMNDDLVLSAKQEMKKVGGVPRRSADLTLKGGALRMFTSGRDASLSASYTQELINPAVGDANGYLNASARIALFRGVYLDYNYNAVYPYDNSSPQSTMSGGVSFGFGF